MYAQARRMLQNHSYTSDLIDVAVTPLSARRQTEYPIFSSAQCICRPAYTAIMPKHYAWFLAQSSLFTVAFKKGVRLHDITYEHSVAIY